MKAKVFVDAVSPSILAAVRRCAEKRFSGAADVVECAPQGFIAAWHSSAYEEQSPTSDRFTCFFTESKTIDDADVVYATFNARIPTFSLVPCEPLSPLLVSVPAHVSVTSQNAEKIIDSFFHFPDGRGKVIVVEGGDGAGKETQTRLLVAHLRQDDEKKEVHTIDFPHEAAPYGGLVRVVLSGKKGSISELDPRLFSFIYSLNRYGCLPELQYWIRRGFNVVLDRYYTANFGHQASKLPKEKRKPFIHHLERCEVDWLGLPRADQVFYLDLPSKVALEAMKNDATRAYLDIHETAGKSYKEGVRQTYLWCCKELRGWKHVLCCDRKGTRRTREDLHSEIYAQAEELLRH